MSIQFSIDALPSQTNEDRHRIVKLLARQERSKASYSFIGLYDGYDGKDCVDYVKDKLHKAISSNESFHNNNIRKAIEQGYISTDAKFLEETKKNGDISGCSAITTMVSFQPSGRKLFVANVGDAKAVLCKRGKPHVISHAHTTKDNVEQSRVKGLGAEIVDGKLMSMLHLTRAFGSKQLKKNDPPPLIANPFVHEHSVKQEDESLVVATAPFWRVYSPEDVAAELPGLLKAYDYELKLVCGVLLKEAYARTESRLGHSDIKDMTVAVILLNPPKEALGVHDNQTLDGSETKTRKGDSVASVEARLGRPLNAMERLDMADGKFDGEYFGDTIGNSESRRRDRETREREKTKTRELSAMERLDLADGKMDGAYYGDAIEGTRIQSASVTPPNASVSAAPKPLSPAANAKALNGVRVTVHHGEVQDKDFFGKSDPYVVLTLDGTQNKTSKRDSLKPEWQETFNFRITSSNPVLGLEVYDRDKVDKDDALGTGTLSLEPLKTAENGMMQNVRVPLTLKDKPSGFINLSLVASWKIVQEAVDYVTAAKKVSTILLTINEGKGIKDGKLLGKSKLYTVVKTLPVGGDDTFKTLVQPLTDHGGPEWREQRNFNVVGKTDFKIEVYEDDGDMIGEIQVPFQELGLHHGAGSRWIPIFKKHKKSGEISIHYVPGHGADSVTKYNGGCFPRCRITVLEAKSLVKADKTGKSDPYCKVEVLSGNAAGQSFKTKVKQGLDPVWNESHEFDVNSPNDIVMFTVMDKDTFGSDDVMGLARIPINSISNPVAKRIRLEDEKGVPAGELCVRFEPLEKAAAPARTASGFSLSQPTPPPPAQHQPPPPAQHSPARPANAPESLVIRILAARDLPAESGFLGKVGTIDPYVIVQDIRGKQKQKTGKVKNSSNPTWNHDNTFEFNMHGVDKLEFIVMDDDTFKDDKLCTTTASALDYGGSQQAHEKWLPLYRTEKGQQVHRGDLLVWFNPKFAAHAPAAQSRPVADPKPHDADPWGRGREDYGPRKDYDPRDSREVEKEQLRRRIQEQRRINDMQKRQFDQERKSLRIEIEKERESLQDVLEDVRSTMTKRELEREHVRSYPLTVQSLPPRLPVHAAPVYGAPTYVPTSRLPTPTTYSHLPAYGAPTYL